jgi:hypothetical protein
MVTTEMAVVGSTVGEAMAVVAATVEEVAATVVGEEAISRSTSPRRSTSRRFANV